MIHSFRLVGAVGLTALVSGCASARSFVDVEKERDQLQALQASLSTEGRPLARDVVDSAAVLITYRYTLGESPKEYQDTVEGAEGVAGWLAAWDARPNVAFSLTPDDVVHCGTYAIQAGTYPIPGAKPNDAAVRQGYYAQWVPDSTGRLKLWRLWLTPDSRTRPVMWGAGCHSLSQLTAEAHRLVVTVEGLFLGHRAIDETITAALNAQGYHTYLRREHGTRGIPAAIGATYRITPRYGIRLIYQMVPASFVQGRVGYPYYRHPELLVDDDALAMLGVLKVGWVQLGAGPAIAPVRFKWRELVKNNGTLISSTTQAVPGVMGEIAVQIPGLSQIGPILALRYTRLRDAEAPGYANIPAFPIRLRRLDATVGMSVRF